MFRMVIGLVCVACSGGAFDEAAMVESAETSTTILDAAVLSDRIEHDTTSLYDSASERETTPDSYMAEVDSGNDADASIVCNGRVCPICGGSDTCCTLEGACGCGYLSVHKCYPLPESNP